MDTALHAWRMVEAGKPLQLSRSKLPTPGAGEALLKVRACGLCHTDRSFLYEGVRTNAPLPLTLGHEIVGEVLQAGADTQLETGQLVLVPAVLPCGDCHLCDNGRGNVCRKQRMPGNDIDGGFASHILVPAEFLCELPADIENPESLAVLADAGSTAYQSVLRCDLAEASSVVVVGAGGVGGFAVQCARALGARVVALDVDDARLESIAPFAELVINVRDLDQKELRKQIQGFEKDCGLEPTGRRILECSGNVAGQTLAYSLLNHNAVMCVVGFTLDKPTLRLSNLMAFNANLFGNWGCLPEHYPKLIELVRKKKILLEPFVETHPMKELNALLADPHHLHRPILIPDFEA